ncbi:hypothetical protein K438DRAFT_1973446 [Mycena galopus ATCC 62051]|nr:hypothetical protein K438DRAFT_1973446 [Mycena galopus ATCC 62051]
MSKNCGKHFAPTVTYWGDTVAIKQTDWPLPAYSISNTILAIVDAYLIHRLYALWVKEHRGDNLSVNVLAVGGAYLRTVVSLAAQSFSVVQLTGYIIGFIPLVRSSTLTVRNNAKIGAIITFISFVRRYVYGCWVDVETTDHEVEFLAHQFLYSLALMVNFNIRRNSGSSSASKKSQSCGGNNNIVMEGIQIHRTAIVTMDPTDSEQEAARRRMEDSGGKQDPDLESLAARKVVCRGIIHPFMSGIQ